MQRKGLSILLAFSMGFSLLATTALALTPCEHYPDQVSQEELVENYVSPPMLGVEGVIELLCPICGHVVDTLVIPALSPDPGTPSSFDEFNASWDDLNRLNEADAGDFTRPADATFPPVPVNPEQSLPNEEPVLSEEGKKLDNPGPTDPQRPEESRAEEPKPYEDPAMRAHQTISYTVAHGRISIYIDGTEYHGLHINGVQFLGWRTDGPGRSRADHVHTLQLVARTATCTEAGMCEFVICSECTETCFPRQGPVEIAALGHDYGGWTDEQGDCQTESSRFRTCSRCGHEDRQTLGKGEHRWAAIGENYEEEVSGFVVWGHYEECSVCHAQRQVEEGREKLMVEDPPAN